MQYRNIAIHPKDVEALLDVQTRLREIVDKQPGATLCAVVSVFWFSDVSFAIIPFGPDSITPHEALTMLQGAAIATEELGEVGVWSKG